MKKAILVFLLIFNFTVISTSLASLQPNAVLWIKASVLVADITPVLGDGSWFSLEAQPGVPIYTAIAGLNHIRLGIAQPALAPNAPNIDEPWLFSGNQGVHFTSGDLHILTDDDNGNVTLDFSVWNVSWNAIPSISLDEGADNGVASLKCYTSLLDNIPGTCANNEEFLLTYNATVPAGDPSGKGGVKYHLHIEGVILNNPVCGIHIDNCMQTNFDVTSTRVIDANDVARVFLPGTTANSVGNTSGIHLIAADIGVVDPLMNSDDGAMCVGGCLDFIIEDVTTDFVDVVFKLNQAIPENAILRKLINGQWQSFDESSGDLIGSAFDDGAGNCQGPDGFFNPGLTAGSTCLFIRIYDGGPNDTDGLKNGTIVDPSGILLPGSPVLAAVSSSGGCSISRTPVMAMKRVDWLIVAGFIALIGLRLFMRKHLNA